MKTNDYQLDFVLHYYQEGKLDTQQAIRRLTPQPRRRRLIAVAASLLALVAFAATITVRLASPQGNSQPAAETAQPAKMHTDTVVFHFNDTPIQQVLGTLGAHYGVQLHATDTTKRLTGDFKAHNLDHIINMIEEVLSVEITQND